MVANHVESYIEHDGYHVKCTIAKSCLDFNYHDQSCMMHHNGLNILNHNFESVVYSDFCMHAACRLEAYFTLRVHTCMHACMMADQFLADSHHALSIPYHKA